MLKCHFNKVADLWPATLLKRDPAQVFSREFCEIFYNIYFVYDYRMSYKIGVLKNFAKFTAKFM